MAPTRRHAHAVITLLDPEFSPSANLLPTASLVEVGGTVQWRCETPDYPEFDIIFKKGLKNPFNDSLDGWTKAGDIYNPVVEDVAKDGEFEYEVKHRKKAGGGSVHRGKHFIHAHICLVCR